MKKDLKNARENYTLDQLRIEDTPSLPIDQFTKWLDQYKEVAKRDYNAMTISTVDAAGQPSSRIVLLKDIDQGKLGFFTGFKSQKGAHLANNPKAALNFYWPELERQVRVEGEVEKMSEEASTVYFKSRPVESQIGACASPQSEVIADRSVLEDAQRRLRNLDESVIQKPEDWGGYFVKPNMFEFWQGRSSRLHDRIRYRLEANSWVKERLAP
jgi:pyridoxamine 5'-phosphate oxidase